MLACCSKGVNAANRRAAERVKVHGLLRAGSDLTIIEMEREAKRHEQGKKDNNYPEHRTPPSNSYPYKLDPFCCFRHLIN
jgi:hypothetical protein